jgi:hypothetical protein
MGVGINHWHRNSSSSDTKENKIVQSSRVQKFKVKSERSQATAKQPAAIARRRRAIVSRSWSVFVDTMLVGLIKQLTLFKLPVFGFQL